MPNDSTVLPYQTSSRRHAAVRELFLRIMDDCIVDAVVRFDLPDGGSACCGAGANRDGDVRVAIFDDRLFRDVLLYGNLGLGESYAKGYFEVSHGSLSDFLLILLKSRVETRIRKKLSHMLRLGALRLGASFRRKEENIHLHYDSGIELFEKFLDPAYLVYSCGYAKTSDSTLEELQVAKMDRICRKLQLKSDERLLDIGCGYGGMLIYAAQNYDIRGLGITNSREMYENSLRQIQRYGLTDRLAVEYLDFCDLPETSEFDKVVSVGMMEHVKRSEYGIYWRKIAGSLRKGGRALIHTIACATTVNEHDPFIQKYIFPGSNQPRLSEIAIALERNALYPLDIENIVRHYSFTLKHWLRRFEQNCAELQLTKEVERIWIYYLNCGIVASLAADSMVLQVLITNDCTIDIPLARV